MLTHRLNPWPLGLSAFDPLMKQDIVAGTWDIGSCSLHGNWEMEETGRDQDPTSP